LPSLFRNATWGGLSAAIRLVFGMANLFLAIRLAGAPAYGYVALMLSVAVIYLTFINSIHTIAVTHAADIKRSNTFQEQLTEVFSIVWTFTLAACVLITLLVLCFGDNFIQGFVYWGNDNLLAAQIKTALFLLLVQLIFQLLSAANVAVMESLGRFDLAARAQMFGPVLCFILLSVMFLKSGIYPIQHVVLVITLAALLDTVLTTAVRLRMGYLAAYLPQKNILRLFLTLLKQGLSLQGSRLVNVFVDPLNKYLLNLFVGAASVTVYEVAMKVITGIQGLFGGAFRTFLQLTNEMRINSGQEYLKSLRYGLLPALLLHAIAGVLIIYLSIYWFRDGTSLLPALFYLMTPASVLIIFIAPLYFALIGIRDLKFIFQMNLNLAVFNVIGSVLFIPIFGVFGCAIGFTLAILFNAFMEYRRYVLKIGEIPELVKEIGALAPKLILVAVIAACSLITQGLFKASMPSILIQSVILASLVIMLLKQPITTRMLEKTLALRPIKSNRI